MSLFACRSWRVFNLGDFTFGDELHIEPRWRIAALAVDPEFRKNFVHGIILKHGGSALAGICGCGWIAGGEKAEPRGEEEKCARSHEI